jgi:Na+/H+-dicarboxylate symporter
MGKKVKLALHWQILIGICLGVLLGIFGHEYTIYTKWLGDLFLNGLKMVVIPLVFSALIMGVSSIGETKDLGRIAGKTLLYYLFTTLIACILGLLLVNAFKPGFGMELNLKEEVTSIAATQVSIIDQIVILFLPILLKPWQMGICCP